ncbi:MULTISPECIES: crotonase/enoyl-CoA hydratase family protein [Phenylobacterium]|jgi:enoyl-CoA hydratase/carnithine racemase|uniref:Crotonase/enoyl-CoA hydratase family protein n=1 Tax=Phenylobacterium conjunctum TaxID=1298959 RepID=A0ABW3T7K7_9CAUL
MATPTFETITLDVEDGVAILTLNRPDKLNAFNTQMMKEMIACFDHTDANDDIKAVIITGSGRAFCAGADLSAGAATFDYDSQGGEALAARKQDGVQRDGGGLLTLRIYDSLKPVIGAINGAAVGIGVTMQLAMDIRLASTAAKFGFVFSRRGINPEAASSWFLPRLVGVQTALEWCYTGRIFPAQEALDKGLVRSVHEPDDLLPAAKALAREIVDNTAPVSIAITRQLIWRMAGANHPMEAHRADSRGIHARGKMADAKEGVVSFLEKRPARYPDKVSTDVPDIWSEHWQAPTFK